MKGVRFVVNEAGQKTDVTISLKMNPELWKTSTTVPWRESALASPGNPLRVLVAGSRPEMDAEFMDEYSIVFARSARKELVRLDVPLGSRILRRIESLARTPRPEGCRKLQGATNLWRIRVGDYRALYSVDDAPSNSWT
jgi:mRNA interferase RelE/StbE